MMLDCLGNNAWYAKQSQMKVIKTTDWILLWCSDSDKNNKKNISNFIFVSRTQKKHKS